MCRTGPGTKGGPGFSWQITTTDALTVFGTTVSVSMQALHRNPLPSCQCQ